MRPRSNILSSATGDSPVDLAKFRTSANVTDDQLIDTDLLNSIETAIDIVQNKTGLVIRRGTYTAQWDDFPRTPKFISDPSIVFPGFHATVNTVEYQDTENNWTTLTDLIVRPKSELGSIRVQPGNCRWPDINKVRSVRITGTAGCDTNTNKIHGTFYKSLVLAFRYDYYDEQDSMDSLDKLLDLWITTGSLL